MPSLQSYNTIQQAYIAYYQRPADSSGDRYWADRLEANGGDINEVIDAFGNSAESEALYGPINSSTIGAVIDAIYLALFDRAPDAAGKQFYIDGFNAGTFTAASIAWNVLVGAQNDDAVAVTNKTQVADEFTQEVDGREYDNPTFGQGTQFNATYAGPDDAAAARGMLADVTSQPSTVLDDSQVKEFIKVEIADPGDPILSESSGTTFTLTNGVDNVVGTNGNDVIIAGTQAGFATLNAGDQIAAGAGTDTLTAYGNLNAGNFSGAAVSSVEVVTALFDADNAALNVSGNAGVTNVNVGNSTVTDAAGTGQITVTLTKAQAAGIVGTILNDTTVSAAGNNANVNFAFSDVSGGADTATLNVENARFAKNALNVAGVGSGVTIAGVETLNIAAAGTNALGNLLAAQTTKMVITGAGSLSATLSQPAGLTKTIDGSAATGNLTINNSAAAAAIQSIKTGSGNDTYTTIYADLTKDDVIELGTGTDSLRFADAATFNSAATKAFLEKVTGVEQLGTVSALLTVDGDFVSQTSYYTDGAAGSMALTNVANNADVNFGAGAMLASVVGMKLGSNTLNVNLKGSAAAASDLTAGLTVTGSATLNVNSAGTDGVANNVLALTAADNQSVVVTGSQNLTLTATAATGTTGFSIDGSAFTGKLNATGTAATDIVKGGSGEDIIFGGAGALIADSLTGGAAKDAFTVLGGTATGTFDTITDFVTKLDTIDFGGPAGTSTNYTEATAAVADYAAALAAANVVLVAPANVYNVQQVGLDVYVFYNDGVAAGADQALKLTGVALTGIEFADLV